MSEYTIWCEKLQVYIEFDSFINDDNIEMFNLTAIANQFDYTNKNIVDWFNMNISTLNFIDSIISEEDLNNNDELINISEKTIIKYEGEWYVNFNVLIEYLRKISFSFMIEFITQIMFDKVNTELKLSKSDEEYSSEETSEYYSENNSEDISEETSEDNE